MELAGAGVGMGVRGLIYKKKLPRFTAQQPKTNNKFKLLKINKNYNQKKSFLFYLSTVLLALHELIRLVQAI